MGREHQGTGPDLHREVDRLVNAKRFEEVEEVWPDEVAPLVSIAISLKRLADVFAPARTPEPPCRECGKIALDCECLTF